MHIAFVGDRFALGVVVSGVEVDCHLRGVGQSVSQPELGAQHLVDRTDNEIDHGFRGIPDAPRLALGRVIRQCNILTVAGEDIASHKRNADRMGWVRQGGEGLSTDQTVTPEESTGFAENNQGPDGPAE